MNARNVPKLRFSITFLIIVYIIIHMMEPNEIYQIQDYGSVYLLRDRTNTCMLAEARSISEPVREDEIRDGRM